MPNDNAAKWTPEAREQQRAAVQRWKPWKRAGRPPRRLIAHEQLASALMSFGKPPIKA
jgi:hypothetical protein